MLEQFLGAAKQRKRPRDVAIFLILRYTGMRRESVATLQVRHLDGEWGMRNAFVKGGKTRDIPLPAAVMQFLHTYVDLVVAKQGKRVMPDTALFWSHHRGLARSRRPA